MIRREAAAYFTAFLVAGCVSAQTPPAARLDFRVYMMDLEQPKFGNQPRIAVHTEIRNVGKTTAVLATKALGPVIAGNAALVDLMFMDMQLQTPDGFRIAYSPAEIAPVELRPGEVIMLSHEFTKPTPVAVRVTYRISRAFAERYGLWHGELKSEAISLITKESTQKPAPPEKK